MGLPPIWKTILFVTSLVIKRMAMTKTVIDNFFNTAEGLELELNFDFTEEAFFDFCRLNRDLRIERDKNGIIHIMSPTGFDTGSFNSNVNADLNYWNRKAKSGKVGDSNTGYTLPNGAIRAPDASWVSNERLARLTAAERKKFAPVCPEFVIEIRSLSDKLNNVKAKMVEYIENGCLLGWLIDQINKKVYIYRANGSIEIVESFAQKLSGENVLPGFELTLKDLID